MSWIRVALGLFAFAGITTVRLFPPWRGFEPVKGTWKWEQGDALMRAARESKIEISAILMGSPPERTLAKE